MFRRLFKKKYIFFSTKPLNFFTSRRKILTSRRNFFTKPYLFLYFLSSFFATFHPFHHNLRQKIKFFLLYAGKNLFFTLARMAYFRTKVLAKDFTRFSASENAKNFDKNFNLNPRHYHKKIYYITLFLFIFSSKVLVLPFNS